MGSKSSEVRERRAYGKSPLALDLSGAIAAVLKIAQGGRVVSESDVAIILGNTTSSSAFLKKIRALCSYGLLTEGPTSQFTLTELALSIAFPRSAQSEADAKKEAFLKIESFNLIFRQHKGKLLPADEFLRNILEQDEGIPREHSREWVKNFKESARAANLLYHRADGKVQISDSPITSEAVTAVQVEAPETKETPERQDANGNSSSVAAAHVVPAPFARQSQTIQITDSGHYTRIDLSGSRRAEISIPDNLSAHDAERLKKALQGIAVIIDSMISGDE